jgi:two-component system, NtrC family, response regulator AtoC
MDRDAEAELPPGAAVLIVDDERSLRFTIGEALRGEGFRVFEASGGGPAFSILREERIDLVLLDQKLKESGEDGLDILRQVKKEYPEAEVVMMTAFGRFESAVEATKLGCYQYLGKPFEIDQLILVIRAALESSSLRREVEVLKRAESGRAPMDLIEGKSARMVQLLSEVDRIAEGTTTVLLRGETGVGKELIARRVHQKSPMANGPFVEVNCSALPENLLESELFGYEKGAFTDARKRKLGLFELAEGGTLFLDEIGEMSVSLQAKLLRALETKSFKRLGGTSNVYVNARIVAATNRDLKKAVTDGVFREDLYYRLSVVPVVIPPLRERTEDIPVLTGHFVRHFNRELRKNVSEVTPRAMDFLMSYNWPGNVRELRNVIERAILLGNGQLIEPEHFPMEILSRSPAAPAATTADLAHELEDKGGILTVAEAEQFAIQAALARYKDNKTRAAEALGISRQTLRAKLKEYGLPE